MPHFAHLEELLGLFNKVLRIVDDFIAEFFGFSLYRLRTILHLESG